jgi:hypothetical protein
MECDGTVEVPHHRLLWHSTVTPTETGSRLDVRMAVIPHGPLRLLLPLLRRRMQQQEFDNLRFIKGSWKTAIEYRETTLNAGRRANPSMRLPESSAGLMGDDRPVRVCHRASVIGILSSISERPSSWRSRSSTSRSSSSRCRRYTQGLPSSKPAI